MPSRTSPRAAKWAKYLKTLALWPQATFRVRISGRVPQPLRQAARRERNTSTTVSVTTPARARPSAIDQLARAASVGRYLHLQSGQPALGPRGHLNGLALNFRLAWLGPQCSAFKDSFIPPDAGYQSLTILQERCRVLRGESPDFPSCPAVQRRSAVSGCERVGRRLGPCRGGLTARPCPTVITTASPL
jgi:hypothetical protein